MTTLSIDDLRVRFNRRGAALCAVRGVSLDVAAAECVGIVGESGSGKTQVFMAAMGLLPPGAQAEGSVRFEGAEILGTKAAVLNRVRGSRLAMVFQDPMTSLTPHLTVGSQLSEVLMTHAGESRRDADSGALRMLERVQVPEPRRRLRQYPHELSGGLRQRVMIGMALLCEPSLLIADEPTTALDVTVQSQIMDLLRSMRRDSRTAVVLISHDLGVVAGLADRIAVMYGGRVVETGAAGDILQRARHPYTAALLQCVPNLRAPRQGRMPSLSGQPPSPTAPDAGCAFAPRCAHVAARCREERPRLRPAGAAAHAVACHFALAP